MERYSGRKFVDGVLKATYGIQWPVKDPNTSTIEPGDYGSINLDTGDFEQRGNIYTNPEVLELVPELKTEAFKPRLSEEWEKDRWVLAQRNLDPTEVQGTPNGSAGDAVDTPINVEFSFKDGIRGAFLAMYRPQSIELPKDILLEKLHKLPPMIDLFLVTGVTSCFAYSYTLGDKQPGKTRLTLVTSGEKPGWVIDNKPNPIYKEACDLSGERKYKGTFTLRQMRNTDGWPGFRDSPGPTRHGDVLWVDAWTPWISLDEEGDEEEFIDDVAS